MKNAGFSNPEPTHFFFMANAFGTLQITCSVVFPFLIFCIFVATSHHNHNSTFLHSPPSHIASHMLSCSQLHRASQIRPRWGMVNHEASRFDHPKKVILCDFHRFCNSNQEAHYSRLLSSVCIYCCVYSFVTGSSLAIALTGAKSWSSLRSPEVMISRISFSPLNNYNSWLFAVAWFNKLISYSMDISTVLNFTHSLLYNWQPFASIAGCQKQNNLYIKNRRG